MATDFDPKALGLGPALNDTEQAPNPAALKLGAPRKEDGSLDPDAIHAYYQQNPSLEPSESEWRAMYDARESKPFLQKYVGEPVVGAAKGIYGTVRGLVYAPIAGVAEAAGALTGPEAMQSPADFARVAKNAGAAVVEGPAQALGGLARQGIKAFDYLGSPIARSDPQKDYERFKKVYRDDLALAAQAPMTQSFQKDYDRVTTGKETPEAELVHPEQFPSVEEAAGTIAGAEAFGGALKALGAAKRAVTGAKTAAPVETMLAKAEANGGKVPGANAGPGLAARGAAATGSAAASVGKGMSWLGDLPENVSQWFVRQLSGSPELAARVGKQVKNDELVAGLGAHVLGFHWILPVVGALKVLEKAGKLTTGLGNFVERVAQADANSPLGRLYALSQDKTAPEWMRELCGSPVVRAATHAAERMQQGAKGAAVGAAVGAAPSILAGEDPEQVGESMGGGAVFGGGLGFWHGRAITMRQRQLGALADWVQAHLDAGVSPETLKLVSSWDAMQTASAEKLAKDGRKVRYATAQDVGSPFAPAGTDALGQMTKQGTAFGQAGWTDDRSNTLWLDPTKRAAGETLLHEFFHPVWNSLLVSHPEVKQAFDRALKADGKTVDDAKTAYVRAELGYTDDVKAVAAKVAERDAAEPDWIYADLLCDAAGRNLYGMNLPELAEPSWSQQRFGFNQPEKGGTIFQGFEKVFDNPAIRRLSLRSFQEYVTHRAGIDELAPQEAQLTKADMGGTKSPFYVLPDGREVNPYGTLLPDGKGGKRFVAFPPSEVRRRLKAEQVALDKYFPKGQPLTAAPDAFWNDPDIAPWTKAALKQTMDAIANKTALQGWYHRLNKENSATSSRSWARDVARSLGNVQISYQTGFPVAVERTQPGNLIIRWASLEAARQKAEVWKNRKGDASLELWGDDAGAFLADSKTYLANHAAGQPGEANGIGQAKRDVLNAFWFGDNKEYQAKNPLRTSLKKADRQGVFRSLRVDRAETLEPAETELARPDWEKGKMNFSPSADPRAVRAAAVKDEAGRIFDGAMHAEAAAKYWRERYPNAAESTLYGMGLGRELVDGFVTNSGEFLNRAEAFQRATELGQYKATPLDESGRLEATKFGHQQAMQAAGYAPNQQFSPTQAREIELEGPDGKRYKARFDGFQDFSMMGKGLVPQITPLEDLPGATKAKSTTYGPSLEKRGFKLPDDLGAPAQAAEAVVAQAAQERAFSGAANIVDNKTSDVNNGSMFSPSQKKELPNAVGPETLKLVHLSSNPGLTETSPKHFGKGRATRNDLRGANKTFFFLEGSPLMADENVFGLGGYHTYTAEVPGDKIYDLRADKPDPLGYYDFSRLDRINREEADAAVRKAGYNGILVGTEDGRQIVYYFESLPVQPAGDFKGDVAQPLASREKSGLDFKDFFSQATKGEIGTSSVPWEPIMDLGKQSDFRTEQAKHTGNFDEHIAKSIPGFRETQVRTGSAIVKTFGKGADMLDIAASEGSYTKTISALSQGRVRTVSLDPNPDMANFFATKSQVPGATYDTSAFLNGFEDNGTTVPAYNPTQRFDVVHESMGFQFISPDRAEQIAEVKRLMKPNGVFLTEEKVLNKETWAANEAKKDKDYKAKYFTGEELAKKNKVVGFQQSEQETKRVGMLDNMVTDQKLEEVLAGQFKHVIQYWDSGNFRGYAASDDIATLRKLVRNMGNLRTEFSTVKTPRKVEAPKQFSPARADYAYDEEPLKEPTGFHAFGSIGPKGEVLGALNPAGGYRARSGARGDFPWSYDADTKTVNWWEKMPAKKQQAAVSVWLRQRGYPAVRQAKGEGGFAFSPAVELSAGPNVQRQQEVRAAGVRNRDLNRVLGGYRLSVVPAGDKFKVVNGAGEYLGTFPTDQAAQDFVRQQRSAVAFSPSAPKDQEKAPVFYSQLSKVVEAKFSGKQMPAAQLAAILRNPQNGVKADELKWSGLDDFLKGKGRVTKEEVQGFLKANQVQVQEVVKHKPFEGMEDTAENPTKFQQYQLPGGENYREILFTLPEASKVERLRRFAEATNQSFEELAKSTPEQIDRLLSNSAVSEVVGQFKSSHWDEPNVLAHTRVNDRTDTNGKPGLFVEEIQSDWHQRGRREGYKPEPGELGALSRQIDTLHHERAALLVSVEGDKERPGMEIYSYAAGNTKQIRPENRARVEAIDEQLKGLYAKYNQAERRSVPNAPFKNTWHEMVFRRLVRMAAEEGKDWIGWTTGEQQAERYDLSKQISKVSFEPEDSDYRDWSLGTLYAYDLNNRQVMRESRIEPSKIADYIGKEPAEKLLAQIEERKSRRKRWEVEYDKEENRFVVRDDDGELLYDRSGSLETFNSAPRAHEFITDLVANEPDRDPTISGLDLKVGGEGMKGFYDEILVDYANKFGKKFGARVEDKFVLSGRDEAAWLKAYTLREVASDTWQWFNDDREPVGPEFLNEKAAEDWQSGGSSLEIHSLPVTPEMKASVLGEGVQMFSPSEKRSEPFRSAAAVSGKFQGEGRNHTEAVEHLIRQGAFPGVRSLEDLEKLSQARQNWLWGKVKMGFFDQGGNFVDQKTAEKQGVIHGEQLPQQFSPAAEDRQGEFKDLAGPKFVNVGSMTMDEIGQHFPEAVKAGARDEKRDYDILGAPLIKGQPEDQAVKTYADKLETEARKWLEHPVFKSGLKWYSEFVPMLKRGYGKQARLMAQLLAATSPRANPGVNWGFAEDALMLFNRGHFNKQLTKYEQGVKMLDNGTLERWFKTRQTQGRLSMKKVPANPGPGSWLTEWVATHKLEPRQSNGALYGMRSAAVLDVLAGRWLENNEGLKVNQFVQNLLGTDHGATVDVWAARLMRRLGYEGLKERWRILPMNETGVTDPDFLFSQKVFAEAAKRLGVTPDALQGGMWFAEKQHWHNQGWSPLDLGDFRKEIKKAGMIRQRSELRLEEQAREAKAARQGQPAAEQKQLFGP